MKKETLTFIGIISIILHFATSPFFASWPIRPDFIVIFLVIASLHNTCFVSLILGLSCGIVANLAYSADKIIILNYSLLGFLFGYYKTIIPKEDFAKYIIFVFWGSLISNLVYGSIYLLNDQIILRYLIEYSLSQSFLNTCFSVFLVSIAYYIEEKFKKRKLHEHFRKL